MKREGRESFAEKDIFKILAIYATYVVVDICSLSYYVDLWLWEEGEGTVGREILLPLHWSSGQNKIIKRKQKLRRIQVGNKSNTLQRQII